MDLLRQALNILHMLKNNQPCIYGLVCVPIFFSNKGKLSIVILPMKCTRVSLCFCLHEKIGKGRTKVWNYKLDGLKPSIFKGNGNR